jgi:ubiquinone/menaquinone biosynthesis C-methylase UbiE
LQSSEVKKTVANYYDKRQRSFESVQLVDRYRNEMEGQILMSRLIGIKGTFLDLGCGTGRIGFLLNLPDGDTVGLDFSKQNVISAQRFSKKVRSKFSFIIGEAEYLPFRNCIFHLVLSIGMLEYVNKPKKIFGEINRITNRDGLVMLSCSNRLAPFNLFASFIDAFVKDSKGWKSFHHIPRRIAAEAERAGFSSELIGYFTLPPPTSRMFLKLYSSKLSSAIEKLLQFTLKFDLLLSKTPLSQFLGTTILLVCKPCDVSVK